MKTISIILITNIVKLHFNLMWSAFRAHLLLEGDIFKSSYLEKCGIQKHSLVDLTELLWERVCMHILCFRGITVVLCCVTEAVATCRWASWAMGATAAALCPASLVSSPRCPSTWTTSIDTSISESCAALFPCFSCTLVQSCFGFCWQLTPFSAIKLWSINCYVSSISFTLGLNLTHPHKEHIFFYIQEIPQCRR